MDDRTFRDAMALLFATYPERATNREDMLLVSGIYRQALDDLTSDELRAAVAAHIRASKWFPKPAELRELAEAAAGIDRELARRIEAQRVSEPDMGLLPMRVDMTEVEERAADPAGNHRRVLEEIRAKAEQSRQEALAYQRASSYRGRRDYGQAREADALLEGLRRQRQEGRS